MVFNPGKPYRIQVYGSGGGWTGNNWEGDKWYWRMKAPNGKTVLDGAEGYANKANCLRAANTLIFKICENGIVIQDEE